MEAIAAAPAITTAEPADARRASRGGAVVIYLAAAWSGYFVMGVELLGARLLAPYFGSSTFTWGALIFVFMTCLSIGYLIGGQLSLARPSPRRLGLMLVMAALFAVPIVGLDTSILEWLSYVVPDPRYGSLIGAAVLFGATTVLSGMVSPYAVRLLMDDVRHSGKTAGRLYFVSTLGSAAGTIVTTFYAVLYLEIDTIILTYISTSMAIGGALILVDNRSREPSVQ